MKKWLFLNVILATTLILGACSTSNNVVSNKLISKRKYERGFHINSKSNLKTQDDELDEEELVDEKSETRKSTAVVVKKEKVRVEREHTEIHSTQIAETNEDENAGMEMKQNSIQSTDNDAIETNETQIIVTDKSNKQIETSEDQLMSVDDQSKNLDTGDPLILILLVILAIILPPLAVFLFEGESKRFIIDLILFILGWGAFGFFGGIFWICGLVSVIYALLIVLSVI